MTIERFVENSVAVHHCDHARSVRAILSEIVVLGFVVLFFVCASTFV